MPIRSKGAYGEELKDNQKENDLIVYQEGKANNTANGNSISGGLDPERDLNPEYLANMDMNTPIHGGNQSFNQYGDDSSPEMQATLGGKNEKYTGEATKNSDVNYNPDIKTGDLNPYYVYGQQSQVYGTLHPGYISQRNDNIASALYNEGRVSKEQVADYLAQQEGWYNSSEADRLNTIESIWKRLGQIAQQNKEEEPAPDMELNNDTSGKIYGKSTAETGEPTDGINTLSDANSVFKAMNESRVANYNALNTMQSSDIAASIDSGTIPYGTQAFRDLQEFNPTKYAEIMAEVKRLRGQDNVNAITNGEEIKTSADTTNINTQTTSDAINGSTASVSATQLLKSIDSILESNDTAKSAQELMGSIEKDMATLKDRLKNLKNEANTVFKGDVPDYLVKAYINNRTQEIQNQLSILEDRYNSAYNRYKTELAHSEWEAEYNLKEKSYELDKYKAENSSSSSSSSTNKNYMRTERNNNPTAMTTDMAKMLGGELGVDYEIGDSFVGGDGKTYYTAKLIGDPIETTIRLIDRGIENGIDPFYRANGQPRWSYMDKIGVNKDKWKRFTREQKEIAIKRMLEHEGGSMENMAYYLEKNGSNADYDMTYQSAYEKYLSGDYNKAWLESQVKTMGITEKEFGDQAKKYKEDKDAGKITVEDNILANGGKWVRNDGKVYDFSKSELYKSLSNTDKLAVQALLNNNISKKYINSNRTKYDNPSGIFSTVSEIDPEWSETWYDNRIAAEKKREQGKQGGWISRNETAMDLAKDIYELSNLLDDSTVQMLGEKYNVKVIKDLENIAREQLGDPKITYLASLLYSFESEAAGALKGGNAANSDQDLNNMENLLSLGLSQEQLRYAVMGIARSLYLKDRSEVKDIVKYGYIKPESTWAEPTADRMYETLGYKDLPTYYDYIPKSERQRKMTEQEKSDLFKD